MTAWKKWLWAVWLAAGVGYCSLSAEAGTIYNSPYVSFSPDGKAWTTNAGDQDYVWYRSDGSDDVWTGVQPVLRRPGIGEHYYGIERHGMIPVGKWAVAYPRVNCCHNGYTSGNEYHGVSFVKQTCLKPHYSGWFAYCADCGGLITYGYIYMSRKAAESIHYLEAGTGKAYYYLCPFNGNLEQGYEIGAHACKAVSANRYQVQYLANADEGAYSGYMPPSYHMYDNHMEYEGQSVIPQTRLNKNSYGRIGWKFLGWNTRADGSGSFYADEAEILNLCAGDYRTDKEQGCIKLYAMWERTASTLEVDPAGGSYLGSSGVTAVTQGYGSVYDLDAGAVEPPGGCLVSFETNGGSAARDIRGAMHFTGWAQRAGNYGTLQGNRYLFAAPDGTVDHVFATYAYDPVELPAVYKENAFFGGWYYDKEFTMPAGGAGDFITPGRDMILYAQWVTLRLTAFPDYLANEQRGAVDLYWTQEDKQDKVYKIYQSEDGDNWIQINSAAEISNNLTVGEDYAYSRSEETYTVLYTGFYRLNAWGAQGGDYKTFQGGLGGEAAGKFWLRKGEVLTITVGGRDGYNGGGKGDRYACGGGCTTVYSDRQGLLLVAGGGGGAAPNGDGNAGGSSQSTLPGGMSGEAGASGGGGGYRGGNAGELILHYHVKGVCNHVHSGSASRYGGCYTRPVICGRSLTHVYKWSETWYWGGSDVSYCPNCGAVAANGESCIGHDTDHYDHVCPLHGCMESNTSDVEPARCVATASYAPGCNRTEEYICGYKDGEIISSKSAYGGSSYVNSQAAAFYTQEEGVRRGNGYFTITSEDIGYQGEQQLIGVKAEDRAAPEDIAWDSIQKAAVTAEEIRVSWDRPADRGTTYYHVAESYREADSGRLCTSNITQTVLTTGVKGYYYCVDNKADTQVSADRGIFTGQEQVALRLPEAGGYLHVRVADVAGNLSKTTHIPLGSPLKGDDGVAWPLYTRQLILEEGEHVYAAPDEKTFYVKADGETAFAIQYEAYMQGPATEAYQPDYAVFENAETGRDKGRNIIRLPGNEISDDEIILAAKDLGFAAEGRPLLRNDSYTRAVRRARNREVEVIQKFVLDRDNSGRKIEIIPRAGADFRQDIVWSNPEYDAENALWIIGDGEPPVIDGMEQLEDLLLIDRRDGRIELSLSAADELSGLRELRVSIVNLDNGAKREWKCGADEVIRVPVTEDEPLFSGDFTIVIYAVDNVGNEVSFTYGTTEFDLQAEVERILSPHTPVFKRGESGVLHITVWGYPERVEIEFPPELAEWDDTLNHTYVYELKQHYRQEEDYVFMIPLKAIENAQHSITVRAYKGDRMLELHPAFRVIGVEGTVLDELRTRLR